MCHLADLPFVACAVLVCRSYQKFMRTAFDCFWGERLDTNRTSPRKLEVCIAYRIGQGGQKESWSSLCIKVCFQSSTSPTKNMIRRNTESGLSPSTRDSLKSQGFASESCPICRAVLGFRHCTQALCHLKSLYVATCLF